MNTAMIAPNGIEESVTRVLHEVGKFVHPPKERTIFSLGGRSYYENPASDMLAFFLRPEEEHGFGCLFLSAFLDCTAQAETQCATKIDLRSLSFDGLEVHREVETQDRSRIDVLIDAPDWVMVIENKIYHSQVNPFAAYKAHAQTLRGKGNARFAILSPTGESATPGWTGVSYKDYCRALRKRLTEATYNTAYSKWHVFAREFILHLENELYSPAMTPEQANFVELNAERFKAVKDLDSQYRPFLSDQIMRRLSEAILDHIFTLRDEGWAIRCYSVQWGESHIVFQTEPPGASQRFLLRVDTINLSAEQQFKAEAELRPLRPAPARKWVTWRTRDGFTSRDEALTELCRIGKILSEIFRPPSPPPGPLPAEMNNPEVIESP
jgi:hypothetical protein